jgi:hypothetical protein
MRRIISLLLASVLTVVGGGGLLYLFFFAAGWKGWMVLGVGLIFVAGIVWLYDDLATALADKGK